ncbi:MAG: acyl-CoA dehydrogenase [Polyangiaceae bacterium]|nr:acyl-CoA dehydrogenase [Polyangiaceae bacterium]
MRENLVESLFEGRVPYEIYHPFPELVEPSAGQLRGLRENLLQAENPISGVELLKRWEILSRGEYWGAPLRTRLCALLGECNPSAALSAAVHFALGRDLVENFGTKAQKQNVGGKNPPVFSFALTESSPGSDVSQIQTLARQEGDDFVLSGQKDWVTNGLYAGFFIIVARTQPMRAGTKPGLTTFLVERQPGMRIEKLDTAALSHAGVAKVSFDDLRIPRSAILGDLGKGMRVIRAGLAGARLLVSAAAAGACRRVYNDTISFLEERRAFGRPLANFPSVRAEIAKVLSDVLAVETLVLAAAGDPLTRRESFLERGVVRLFVADAAERVFHGARELYGARAFTTQEGGKQPRVSWADARALTLLDGSDFALQSAVVLEGTEPFRRKIASLSSTSEQLDHLDLLGAQTLERMRGKLRRALSPHIPKMRMDELESFTTALGELVRDKLKKHRDYFVEMHNLHRRILCITTELAGWLALASRVRTEAEKHGEVGARRMREVAEVWVTGAVLRIRSSMEALDENQDPTLDRIAVRAMGDRSYPFEG